MKNNNLLLKFLFLSVILLSLIGLTLYTRNMAKNNHLNLDSASLVDSKIKDGILKNNSINNSFDFDNASIIFEYLNNNGHCTYKTVFDDDFSSEIHPLIDATDSYPGGIPNIIYTNLKKINETYSEPASSILINFSEDICSSFLYDDGKYFLTSNALNFKEESSYSQLKVSNILIQCIDNNTANINDSIPNSDYSNNLIKEYISTGNGYLFCGGKIVKIKWSKTKKDPIKITDEKGKSLSLVTGKLWWIILDKKSNINYR